MAPEQLEGRDADQRADIWAMGATLYEMVTGRRTFPGGSQALLISAIMTQEPVPIAQIEPMTPPALDRVVSACLAKDPENRWQSASDLKRELTWIAEGDAQVEGGVPIAAGRRRRELLAWSLAAIALGLAAAVVAQYERQSATLAAPVRTSIVLPETAPVRAAVLSPDGTRLAFVARDSSGKSVLWIRPLDSLAVQPLAGTENPSFPFWSPDSRMIGFFADGRLKKIDALGGPVQTLCDAPISRGGTWSSAGVILFAPHLGPLYRVSASGGIATPVTRIDPSRGEDSHRWPFFLPDGQHFLYLVTSVSTGEEKAKTGIYVGSLASTGEAFLLRANSSVTYAPPGYLLFVRERNLLAQLFDPKALMLAGDPFPIAEKIQQYAQTYSALFSASNNGLLLYQAQSGAGVSQLVWFDRSGRSIGSLGEPCVCANPRLAPDGKRVALDVNDARTGNSDIWIYALSGGIPTRFTSHPAYDAEPIWSPDGRQIVFVPYRNGRQDLYQKSSSGAGTEDRILQSSRTKFPTDWSPDGRFILFRVLDANSNFELWVVPLTGDGKPIPFVRTASGASDGQFSPDGRWVAYSSNDSGTWEIYVAPFPGPGGNWKISTAGGTQPRWRRDGRELFYVAPDTTLMAVDVEPGPTFEAGAARPLFRARWREPVSANDLFAYDVSADGQRFLINTEMKEAVPLPLTLVVNWTAALKK
jgi:Tol biopolymer transport system component